MKRDLFLDRLDVVDKLAYKRALDSFKKEPGSGDDEGDDFFSTILDSQLETDYPAVQNAINFAKSYCDIGRKLSQKFLDKLLIAGLNFPQIVPQLYIFQRNYSNNWIFYSILKVQKKFPEKFKDSIVKSSPIWDFILCEFEADIQNKHVLMGVDYNDRAIAFLFESILFGWKIDQTMYVTIDQLFKSFVEFCIENESSPLIDTLMSYVCTLFPEKAVEIISNHGHRLLPQCLELFESKGLLDSIGGDPQIMAVKCIPFKFDKAQSLLNNISNSESFSEIYNRYQPSIGRFILD